MRIRVFMLPWWKCGTGADGFRRIVLRGWGALNWRARWVVGRRFEVDIVVV